MARKTVRATRPTRTPLERSIESYLVDVRARRSAKKTLAYYEAVLTKRFLPFCLAARVTDLNAVDQKLVNRWTADLNERKALPSPGVTAKLGKLSVHTVNSYTRTVNQFLRWAHKEGEIQRLVEAHKPKLRHEIREVLRDEDFKRLMDVATEEHRGARDSLILRVLWQTGVRASELCGLRVSDLKDGGNRDYYLHIRSAKGGDERDVPIKPALYKDLKAYAEKRRRGQRGQDDLWLGSRKEGGEYRPLTPSGLGQLLASLADEAEVTKPTNPHSFRHSFITRMVLKDMNMVLLQHVVGHKSPTMIHLYYAHLQASDAGKQLMELLKNED